MKRIGYGYVANNRTLEIHRLNYKHTNFDILGIVDYTFIRNYYKGVERFVKRGYNGCRYCMPEIDNG